MTQLQLIRSAVKIYIRKQQTEQYQPQKHKNYGLNKPENLKHVQ